MFTFTTEQIIELTAIFENNITHPAVDDMVLRPSAAFYRAAADMAEGQDGVEEAAIMWMRAAANVNENTGTQSAFIRNYNNAQHEARYGTSISVADMDIISDKIAQKVLKNITESMTFPSIVDVARDDAEPAALDLFDGDASGWAGNPLFLFLGYDTPFYSNIIEDDPGNPYDALAMMKFSVESYQIPGVDDFGSLGDLVSQIWNYPPGRPVLASAVAELKNFMENAYFDDLNFIDLSTQTQSIILGKIDGNDELVGDYFRNIIHAGGGDDVILSSEGSDIQDGGIGVDTVDYTGAQAINFMLTSNEDTTAEFTGTASWPTNFLGIGFVDTLYSIEIIIGSSYDDIFKIGDDFVNDIILDAGSGNDTLDFSDFTTGRTFDLKALHDGTDIDVNGNTISVEGFEVVIGTGGDDDFYLPNGSRAAGGDGDDTFIIVKGENIGDGGPAVVWGGTGKDIVKVVSRSEIEQGEPFEGRDFIEGNVLYAYIPNLTEENFGTFDIADLGIDEELLYRLDAIVLNTDSDDFADITISELDDDTADFYEYHGWDYDYDAFTVPSYGFVGGTQWEPIYGPRTSGGLEFMYDVQVVPGGTTYEAQWLINTPIEWAPFPEFLDGPAVYPGWWSDHYDEDILDQLYFSSVKSLVFGGHITNSGFAYGAGNNKFGTILAEDTPETHDGTTSGVDNVSYSGSTSAVTVNLEQNTATGGAAEGDQYIGINDLGGSHYDDSLTGNSADNRLSGNDGDDTLVGLAGDDTLTGGVGQDVLDGGDGNDVLGGGFGNDIISGGSGDDILEGGAGDDVMTGGAGSDTFTFFAGYLGGDGVYVDGDGHDTITDFDPLTDFIKIGGVQLDPMNLPAGVSVVEQPDGNGGIDLLISYGPNDTILLVGVSLDDWLPNIVEGTDQDDVLIGTGGKDYFILDAGNDTITAKGGDDTIIYESGHDTIMGDVNTAAHDNTGYDTLDFSKYTADQVSFSISGHNVVITTPDGSVTLHYQLRHAVGDYRSNIENIVFSDGTLDEAGIKDRALADQSTDGDDVITGSYNQSDIISSGSGNDTISANGGNDTIIYDSGDDTIMGHKSNYGDDTLDLSKYTADQVSFTAGWFSVVIDTPDGSITLHYQTRYELGHQRSNIENIVFSDGTLDEAGIRERSISDQATTGDDVVSGTIFGDVYNTGTGNDTITGRGGADVFEFATGDGQDIITDFADGTDLISLLDAGLTFADLSIVDNANGDATITYGGADTVTLEGVTAAQITADDFTFA